MKCERVQLLTWHSSSVNIDVPWPEVHRAVGSAAVTWLNCQDSTSVQLIVDQDAKGSAQLWAEFYQLTQYHEYCERFL